MNQIIVDVGISENRLALVEDEELVELYIERQNNRRMVGNIYKGRIANVLPGMQAAFVDIGLEKNCFLYIKDALKQDLFNKDETYYKDIPITDVVKQGQEITVQVIKEPLGTKGARVTTNITLPGRYLVLMPHTSYIGVSRRIVCSEERERLREAIEQLRPHNMGIIVRTVAEGKNGEDFDEDIKFLLKLWQKIERERKINPAPKLIHRDFDLISKTIRDTFSKDIDKFVINNAKEYKNALELVELLSPSLKSRISYFDEDIEIFNYYKIESQINKSLNRKIWLKSGGYIVIDSTEAFTIIDVNTGKYVGSIGLEDTVLNTNLEAADEIAKQLRLRDIGGIIIIDFIDMVDEEDNQKVIDALEKALSKDKTRSKVLGMTQLGLVEMTRKKVRLGLDRLLQKKCQYCGGSGRLANEYTLLYKFEKEMIRISMHTNAEAVIFETNPTVLQVFKEEKSMLEKIDAETDLKSFIIPNIHLHHNEIQVKAMGDMESIKKLIDKNEVIL
ncbi:MAG: Rne/Rng family ribonuclease [Candidatus Alkaliphilus sp. MAG34]|nr:Rne/Rng family ribonuclease [Clostridiales bacterium]